MTNLYHANPWSMFCYKSNIIIVAGSELPVKSIPKHTIQLDNIENIKIICHPKSVCFQPKK